MVFGLSLFAAPSAYAGKVAGFGTLGGPLGSGTGSGEITTDSDVVTNVVTTSGAFQVGQTIIPSGGDDGINPGTTITAVGADTLTLSVPAQQTGTRSLIASILGIDAVQGLAVNHTGAGGATAGDVYVSDASRNRIAQFSASGNLIRLFGLDVVSSGPDNVTPASEVQSVDVPAGVTGGTFTLTFNGQTTTPLAFDATAETVQTALRALSSIGATGVEVSGGPGATAAYTIAFVEPLAESPASQITVDSTDLTGDVATSSTTTQGVSGFEICDVAANPTDVCQAGAYSFAAGGIAGGKGVAVDPATGNVFLVDDDSKRVDVYSATGQFQGAFGWGVNATAPAEALQFCTYETGCAGGGSGTKAGQFGAMSGGGGQGSSPAVSPLNGHLFVPQPGNQRIDEFSLALNGSNEVTDVAFVKGFGGDVIPTINEQQTVTLTGATGGTFALAFGGKSTDIGGRGDLQQGSNEVSNFKATDGAFVVGAEISGFGIPAGTRITAITFDSLTLTNAATATASGATLGAALPFDASAATLQAALRGLSSVGAGNVTVSGANGGPYTVEFTGSLAGTDLAQLTGDGSNLTGTIPSVTVATIQTGANGTLTGFETCTVATACKAGAGNGRNGTFAASTPVSLAVDSLGSIYATGQSSSGSCGSCTVQKFDASASSGDEFAPAQLTPPDGFNTATFTPKWVAIDPANDHVFVAKRTAAQPAAVKLYEFTRDGALIDSSPPGEEDLKAAQTNTVFGPQGLAIGTGGRAYMAVYQGPVTILGEPPAPKAAIDPASGIGQTSATLHGVAEPSAPGIEGGFSTVAYFEYSADGVTWSATQPVPIGKGTGAGSANDCPAGDPPVCNLSATVHGLTAGTGYSARLVVSNGTTATSSVINFTTTASAPSITGARANPVTRTTATLAGDINPNGKSTSYHFEWGGGGKLDNRIPPDFEAVAGSGSQPVSVSANIAGLSPNTTYRFRIVATSASGTAAGREVEFRTLNEAGLPANRGIELVSPADKRPAGSVEIANPYSGGQIFFQAAEDGEAVGYTVANGMADSTSGGEVSYAGTRNDSGWQSVQVSPAAASPSPVPGPGTDYAGRVRYYNPGDLGCALIETHIPLTADTPPAGVANQIYNLYRWERSTQTYTLISNRVPLNPTSAGGYIAVGASSDCSRIFFYSQNYNLIAGASRLYEWRDGVLRDAGVLPDGSVPAGGVVGAESNSGSIAQQKYSVAPNGRLFFVATSDEGEDAGKRAVFVRNPDGAVVNASQPTSAGAVPLGARYEAASPDGSHVYFLSNYGLTANSSSGGEDNCSDIEKVHDLACDLYDFNVDTGQLRNLSADSNPADTKGSVVQGILDVSADGSSVYFAARGQLVPGEGRTYNQNRQGSEFANVYRWHAGQLSYIGSLRNRDMEGGPRNAGEPEYAPSALIHVAVSWNSQTTNSGEYLLFGSRDNLSGTNPNGVYQAYLYSADTDATECISCPADGTPPAPEGPYVLQQTRTALGYGNYTPRSLSEDGRAFFTTLDALTPNAVEGKDTSSRESENNIYEWHDGQVALLASGPVQLVDIGGPNGRDVFIRSYDQMDPRDFDTASDLYDLRADGGFPEVAPPKPACQVDESASLLPDQIYCQGDPGTSPAPPSPATPAFVGPGNPPAAKPAMRRCGKGKVRRHGKCVAKKKHRKKAQKDVHKRAATTNRGGVK